MRYQSNKKQTNRKEDTVKLLRFSDLGSNMAGTVKRPAQTACPLLTGCFLWPAEALSEIRMMSRFLPQPAGTCTEHLLKACGTERIGGRFR